MQDSTKRTSWISNETNILRFNDSGTIESSVVWPSCSHTNPTTFWFWESQINGNVCFHFLSQFSDFWIATVHGTLIDWPNTFPIMEFKMELDVGSLVLIDERHGKQLRALLRYSSYYGRRAAIALARNGTRTTLDCTLSESHEMSKSWQNEFNRNELNDDFHVRINKYPRFVQQLVPQRTSP